MVFEKGLNMKDKMKLIEVIEKKGVKQTLLYKTYCLNMQGCEFKTSFINHDNDIFMGIKDGINIPTEVILKPFKRIKIIIEE